MSIDTLIPVRYAAPLRHLALTPSTTASELSVAFDLLVDDVLSLYLFGVVEGLILNPVQ